MRRIWTIWKYSLGSFSDTKTETYDDLVAVIRTCIFVSYMVTNIFIVSGVLRHWNEVSSQVSQTEEKRQRNADCNVLQN
jgi:hypothetical protein